MPRRQPAIIVVSCCWFVLLTFMSVSSRFTEWMGRRIYFWGCTLLHQVSVITVFLWKIVKSDYNINSAIKSQWKFAALCCLLLPSSLAALFHVVVSCIWHLYSWFPYCGDQATKVNDCTGTLCKYEADVGKVWLLLLEDCSYLSMLAVPPSSAWFGVLSQKV